MRIVRRRVEERLLNRRIHRILNAHASRPQREELLAATFKLAGFEKGLSVDFVWGVIANTCKSVGCSERLRSAYMEGVAIKASDAEAKLAQKAPVAALIPART